MRLLFLACITTALAAVGDWARVIFGRQPIHGPSSVDAKPRKRYVESSPCAGSSQTLTAHGVVVSDLSAPGAPYAVCPICNEFMRVKHGMFVRHGFTRTRALDATR